MKDHTYAALKSDPLWRVIEGAIDDLVKNQDLDERTSREYIVGYLSKKVLAAQVRRASRTNPPSYRVLVRKRKTLKSEHPTSLAS